MRKVPATPALAAPGDVAGVGSNHGKLSGEPTGKPPCPEGDPEGDGEGR